MTHPYKFNVELFIDHFRRERQAISEVSLELHRKILYCSALDPLARAAFGKIGGHRSRMVDLLINHTDWSDSRRVSLFQLTFHLRGMKRTRFRLYREAKRRLDLSPPRRRLALSGSPLYAEMLPYAAPEELKALARYMYAELFYTYRNNLIHEYREPGYGTDWSRKADAPFYTNLSSFGQRELVFPLAFLTGLYEQALVSVERHLLKEKINPHMRFEFGSHWRA